MTVTYSEATCSATWWLPRQIYDIPEYPQVTILGVTFSSTGDFHSSRVTLERYIQASVPWASDFQLPYPQRRHLVYFVICGRL